MTDQTLLGSYDYRLVVLSVLIAILASYTALDLAGRVTAFRGWGRLAWLTGGATSMGMGIWSMHYIGMLAFSLPVPIQYDWPLVLLSLLAGVFSSVVALFVVSQRTMGLLRALAGSIFMGGGIVALHYIAMSSMRLAAMCHYSSVLVGLSVLIAITGSCMALWLGFFFRDEAPGRRKRKVASALLMAAAMVSMHYTAMAAASFTPSATQPDLSHAVGISTLGIAGTSGVPLMVLVLTLFTSVVGRLQQQRTLLDELFEQAPLAVALLNADHSVIRVNRAFALTFGYTRQETVGRRLSDLIVPDESQDDVQRFWDSVAHGRLVHTEGARRRKDGIRLDVAVILAPFVLPNGEAAAYAIYRDITERKRADAALRELSGQLLRLQDEERRRLARELHDSTAQLLAALSLNLSVVNESVGALNPRAQGALAECVTLGNQCLREIRTVSYLLHPPDLDELGLQSALVRYIDGFGQRSGINVELEVSTNLGRLPQEVETTIFRVVQESLTNIHRHSGTNTASILLIRGPTEIILEAKDAGRGIPPDGKPGVGIASMRERVQQLDGRLEVESNSTGTTVRAFIPVPKAAP